MEYIELEIFSPAAEAYEILTAELAEAGFDSFTVEEDKLHAYIPSKQYNKEIVESIFSRYHAFEITFTEKLIPSTNWNAIWESGFQPVIIEDKLIVKAPFHEQHETFPIEIIIQPKMSFGTGHHATTWLMMNMMLGMDFRGKRVLDFGTGTGILAVLAAKLGAEEIFAVDNDIQCIENAEETFTVNECSFIHLGEGDINLFEGNKYDVITGNITRNTILDFAKDISSALAENGRFIASGFYISDLPLMRENLTARGLKLMAHQERNDWCAAIFDKV